MLWFLVREKGQLRNYFKNWGRPLWGRVRLLKYDDVTDPSKLANGIYIFADLEVVRRGEEPARHALSAALARRGDMVRLLNRPGHVLGRYALLRRLYEAGLNVFRAVRLDESLDGLRFPVFLRHVCEHEGAYSGLISNQADLNNAIKTHVRDGRGSDDLLIVEFVDTSDGNSLFRKYAAVNIDGKIIAHHIMFGNKWEVKGPSLVSPEMVVEERRFQQLNPHKQKLAEIFALAGIEYGRVDYGILDGRIQVWEINTNPNLLYGPQGYKPSQLPAKRWFSTNLNKALQALDDRSPIRSSLMDRWQSYRDFW
jgi:hypothetical protein